MAGCAVGCTAAGGYQACSLGPCRGCQPRRASCAAASGCRPFKRTVLTPLCPCTPLPFAGTGRGSGDRGLTAHGISPTRPPAHLSVHAPIPPCAQFTATARHPRTPPCAQYFSPVLGPRTTVRSSLPTVFPQPFRSAHLSAMLPVRAAGSPGGVLLQRFGHRSPGLVHWLQTGQPEQTGFPLHSTHGRAA